MINIGDMVKVISKSSLSSFGYDGGPMEFIPIGCICEVVNKEYDEDGDLVLISSPGDPFPYWYRESEVEKFGMTDGEMIGILGALLDDDDPEVKDMPERIRKDIWEVYNSLCLRSEFIK